MTDDRWQRAWRMGRRANGKGNRAQGKGDLNVEGLLEKMNIEHRTSNIEY